MYSTARNNNCSKELCLLFELLLLRFPPDLICFGPVRFQPNVRHLDLCVHLVLLVSSFLNSILYLLASFTGSRFAVVLGLHLLADTFTDRVIGNGVVGLLFLLLLPFLLRRLLLSRSSIFSFLLLLLSLLPVRPLPLLALLALPVLLGLQLLLGVLREQRGEELLLEEGIATARFEQVDVGFFFFGGSETSLIYYEKEDLQPIFILFSPELACFLERAPRVEFPVGRGEDLLRRQAEVVLLYITVLEAALQIANLVFVVLKS